MRTASADNFWRYGKKGLLGSPYCLIAKGNYWTDCRKQQHSKEQKQQSALPSDKASLEAIKIENSMANKIFQALHLNHQLVRISMRTFTCRTPFVLKIPPVSAISMVGNLFAQAQWCGPGYATSLSLSQSTVFPPCRRKELIQCKKKKQSKLSDWTMIKETYRWPIKSFVFKSSARPGWRNWWRNFSLIAWYTCVASVLPFRNFFMYIINK